MIKIRISLYSNLLIKNTEKSILIINKKNMKNYLICRFYVIKYNQLLFQEKNVLLD